MSLPDLLVDSDRMSERIYAVSELIRQINLDLYREVFNYNKMGYGAAIAWLLFVIVLGLTLALFAFARKRVYYAGGGS